MEVWKDIPGFQDYQISNLGRLRSRIFRNNEKILCLQKDDRGYSRFRSKHGLIRIHKAVASAFLPNPDNKPEIDHINRDRSDNRLENLRWATRSENNLNRTHHLPQTQQHYIRTNHRLGGDTYRVMIKRLNINRSFKTLEEAVAFRDEVLPDL
jgi:HNH endonuclease/NUMOD4 motif